MSGRYRIAGRKFGLKQIPIVFIGVPATEEFPDSSQSDELFEIARRNGRIPDDNVIVLIHAVDGRINLLTTEQQYRELTDSIIVLTENLNLRELEWKDWYPYSQEI